MRRFVLDLLDLGVALLGQQVFRLAVILLPHLAFGIGIVQVFELLFVVAVRLLHRPGDIGGHVQHLFVPLRLRFDQGARIVRSFLGRAFSAARTSACKVLRQRFLNRRAACRHVDVGELPFPGVQVDDRMRRVERDVRLFLADAIQTLVNAVDLVV